MAYVDHAFSISDEDVMMETSYINNKPPIKEIALAAALLIFGALGVVLGIAMAVNKVGGDRAQGLKEPPLLIFDDQVAIVATRPGHGNQSLVCSIPRVGSCLLVSFCFATIYRYFNRVKADVEWLSQLELDDIEISEEEKYSRKLDSGLYTLQASLPFVLIMLRTCL